MTTNIAGEIAQSAKQISEVSQKSAQKIASKLAQQVVAALVAEATLTPKPGLVDMRSRGAHDDLSWSLMCASASALEPTFYQMALAGWQLNDSQNALELRQTIGAIGRQGEATMMQTTNGINTHRGAIWALGLLVTAAAQQITTPTKKTPNGFLNAAAIAKLAGNIAQINDANAPLVTGNKGEVACRQYGVGGARAQAQAGFPLVILAALPTLQQSRMRGDAENIARLNALLAVMAKLDDTCILSRAGAQGLALVQNGAAQVLACGGVASRAGKAAFAALENTMLTQRLSSGGAADLLAAALFLDGLDVLNVN